MRIICCIIIIIILLIIKHYYIKYIYYKYLCSYNYNSIFNKKCSNIFIKNINNNNLHIQEYDKNYDTIVLSLHGFASHGNRKPHEYLKKKLNENNIEYITFDFTGHGYSDGDKGNIKDINILINDVLLILIYIYNNNIVPIKSLFIYGHSMGGSFAIIIGDLLTNKKNNFDIFNKNRDLFYKKIIPSFKGLILLAPLIQFNFNKICYNISKFIFNIFPKFTIPSFIYDQTDSYHKFWKDDKYIEYIKYDGNKYNKKRLGYSENININTLLRLHDLSITVQDKIKNLDCSFIVLHDKNKDILISKKSIDFLINFSKSSNKKYVNIKESLHDPLANQPNITIFNIIKWIKTQI